MNDLYYAGMTLDDDLKLCEIYDELESNHEVIILNHDRKHLVHEMEFVNNYSTERRDTGKTHIGFDFHFITFYYNGYVWSLNLDTYGCGVFNVYPYLITDNGWSCIQCGNDIRWENLKELSKLSYRSSLKGVYPRDIPFAVNKNDFIQILMSKGGDREKKIWDGKHICYVSEKTSEREIVTCRSLEYTGDLLSFDIDMVSKEIVG